MRHGVWLLAALVVALFSGGCDDGGTVTQEGTDAGVEVDGGTLLDGGAELDVGEADDAQADAALDAFLADANEADLGEPDAAPDPGPVTAPGPYPVGYRADETTYYAPLLDADRTIRIVYWYPAAAPEGAPPRYQSIVGRPDVHTNAPLARAETFPVLVFSHGNGGFAEQSFFLTEFFASHGWVVVAFDHTGNTFNNGGVPTADLFELRPQDVTAVLDHVYGLVDDPLAGRLTEQVIMSGHSFGGYTTLALAGSGYNTVGVRAACEADGDCSYWDMVQARYVAGFGDDRVAAAIPLTPAGAFLFGPGLADVDVPTLLMTAGRDATLPNADEGDPIWEGLARAGNLRLDFGNAGHFSFSVACAILPGFALDDGCGEDFTAADEMFAAINAYALAFARLHLLGDDTDADLLDGSRSLSGILELTLPE